MSSWDEHNESRIKQEEEEEEEKEIDYGDFDSYARLAPSSHGGGIEAFLKDGGMTQEDLRSIQFAEGNRMVDAEREREELLPTQADADIDLDEQLTDIQRKDGINRLKILALMGLTYHHVTTGEGMSAVFQRDAPAESDIRLHLRDRK